MILRRLCSLGLLVFLACSAIGVLQAQQAAAGTFDFDKGREPLVKLDGLWRFHPGDDPRWAEPGFDDSGWAAIRGNKGWDKQGYKGLTGYAWYRASATCRNRPPVRRGPSRSRSGFGVGHMRSWAGWKTTFSSVREALLRAGGDPACT